MKTAIIRNLLAGSRSDQALSATIDALKTHFPTLTVVDIRPAEDMAARAAQLCADGFELLIAAGGDGTISAVAEGILASGGQTALSILSSGTGADFVRNLDIPDQPEALAAHIARTPIRTVDAGRLVFGDGATRHVVNIASLGVSAMVASAVNGAASRRWMPRALRFPVHSVIEIARYRPQSVLVTVDGREIHRGPVTAVAIGNGGWFGGGMHLLPDAQLDDGLLDIAILGAGSVVRVLQILKRLYPGTHAELPIVTLHQGRVIEVEPLNKAGKPLDIDGETIPLAPFRAEILPGALRLKL